MPLTDPLRRAARRTLLGGVGAALAAIGLSFLTLAAWLTLSELEGAVFAAIVLGAAYLGVGALVLAVAGSGNAAGRAAPAARQAEATPANVVDAFLAGMAAGQSARRRR